MARIVAGRVSRSSVGEDLAFQIHVLEDRFDDEVRVAGLCRWSRPPTRGDPATLLRPRPKPAALRGVAIVCLRFAPAPVSAPRRRSRSEATRNARVGKRHRDAASHRAGPEDRNLLDRVEASWPAEEREASPRRARRRRDDGEPSTGRRRQVRAKSARSRSRPASKGRSSAARTASTQACGARRPRARFVRSAAAASKRERSARSSASFVSSSRRRRSFPAAASFRASAMADSVRSPSAIASTRPSRSASAADIGSPLTIILSADDGADGAREALRPAAPGQEPELHLRLAQPGRRRRDARMASKRELEPAAERRSMQRGNDRLCHPFEDGGDVVDRAASARGLPNSLMSAPATNVRPAQAITAASTAPSASIPFSASRRPARTAWESALTGGLSIVTTATPSSTSTRTSGERRSCLVEHRRRLDLDLGGVFHERAHFHQRHRGESSGR